MPQHNHVAQASNTQANQVDPSGRLLGNSLSELYVDDATPVTGLKSGTVANVGGGQAHNNMMPYLVINFVIALQGLFPSRN